MKKTIMTFSVGISLHFASLEAAQAFFCPLPNCHGLSAPEVGMAVEAANENVGNQWGSITNVYDYEDGYGANVQFSNGNVVTTISKGADGSSSAIITNHSDSGAALNSTYYNSSGADIGASLYGEDGSVTTYNACGKLGRPGDACEWTNEETGEVVHISGN